MSPRKLFTVALAVGILCTPLVTEAQQAGKVYRIGYLGVSPPTPQTLPIWEAFLQALRERGWVEGQNILIERRYSEGRAEHLPTFAAELVSLKVDVIVTVTTPAALAAKQSTSMIPIVMVTGDPVGSGLAASLARPGGNVTGLTHFPGEGWIGKHLELLKEAVPKVTRVAVLWDSTIPPEISALREMQVAARTLGVTLQPLEVRKPEDLERAFAEMGRERAHAFYAFDNGTNVRSRKLIVEIAAKNRLPTMFGNKLFVDAGGLMSYSASLPDQFRRAATYVDKILKGAKPADLPVEQPTRFELVINLKTAKALGLTIPQSILIRASQVIR